MSYGDQGSGAADDGWTPQPSEEEAALWAEFMSSGGAYPSSDSGPSMGELFNSWVARRTRASAEAAAQVEAERARAEASSVADDAAAFQVRIAEEKKAAEAAFRASQPPPGQIEFASQSSPGIAFSDVGTLPVPNEDIRILPAPNTPPFFSDPINSPFAPQSFTGVNFSKDPVVNGPNAALSDPFSGYTNFLSDAPTGTSFDTLFPNQLSPFDSGVSFAANGGPILASEHLNAGGLPGHIPAYITPEEAEILRARGGGVAPDGGQYMWNGIPAFFSEADPDPGPSAEAGVDDGTPGGQETPGFEGEQGFGTPSIGHDSSAPSAGGRGQQTNIGLASIAASPAMSVTEAHDAQSKGIAALDAPISEYGLGRFAPAVGWGVNSETGLATIADIAALNALDHTGYAINNPQPTDAGLLASQVFGRLNPTVTNMAFGLAGFLPGVGPVASLAGFLEGRGFLSMAQNAFQALAPETYSSLANTGRSIGQALPGPPDLSGLSGLLGDPEPSPFDPDPDSIDGPVEKYVPPIVEPIPDTVSAPVLPTDQYRLDLSVRDPNDTINFSPFPVPLDYRP